MTLDGRSQSFELSINLNLLNGPRTEKGPRSGDSRL